jgi:hypothetical protein
LAWIPDFTRLLDGGYSSDEIQKMMKLAFSDRWLKFTLRPKNLVDNADKLAGDLKIRVRELHPEKTAEEKRQEKAALQKEKDKAFWHEAGDIHFCTGQCGKQVDREGYMCPQCRIDHEEATS